MIDINVSDDQADDRIDEALQYFAQYHYDGIEKMYLKYQITADDIHEHLLMLQPQQLILWIVVLLLHFLRVKVLYLCHPL